MVRCGRAALRVSVVYPALWPYILWSVAIDGLLDRSRPQPLTRISQRLLIYVHQVLGFSARNASEWDALLDALNAFDLLEITSEHARRAKQVQRILASRHQRGRKIPDLLVAAAAESAGVAVLHYDSGFDLIAAATGQRCEWVVPPGSID